jgi:hypothetical protein
VTRAAISLHVDPNKVRRHLGYQPLSAHDWFYRDDLLVRLERATPEAFLATFNFVLRPTPR